MKTAVLIVGGIIAYALVVLAVSRFLREGDKVPIRDDSDEPMFI